VKKHGIRASHTAKSNLGDCRVRGSVAGGREKKLDERVARQKEASASKGRRRWDFEAVAADRAAARPWVCPGPLRVRPDTQRSARGDLRAQIFENPAIAFTLADMKMEIDAASCWCTGRMDGGDTDGKDFEARRARCRIKARRG